MAHNRKKRRHVDIEMDIDKEDWEKPGTLQISLLLCLPIVVGFIEGDRVLSQKEMIVSKEVVIHATPVVIWQQLLHINAIQQKEQHRSLSGILGFPHHLHTSLDTPAIGGKRIAVYEKGLSFEEEITKYEPGHLMALNIKTDPSKISPTVLDEHIVIGGKHVNLLEDVYTLEQLPDGKCRLSLSSRFYINTPFNWYAGIWANYLMSDILKGELKLIQQRVLQHGISQKAR